MSISKSTYNTLINDAKNAYFKKSPQEKYSHFSKVDPFPDIENSLLNSKDILKYALTAGVVAPFNPKNLVGATYSCEFSGEYIFWDDERIKHTKKLTKGEELELSPNSVIFLGIKPMFRVPEYMILRFNLRVKNVYKGLLLGTGPVVDPGYVGKLFIPVHNLTSNKYTIKKNALLIDIEFTKLSKNDKWKFDPSHPLYNSINNLNFDCISYISTKFDQNNPRTNFDKYIEDALCNDPYFYKENPENPYVNSSMEEELKKFAKTKAETDKKIKQLDQYRTFLTITIASVVFAAVTLIIATGWYFYNANRLQDATQQIRHQQERGEQHEQEIIDYQIIINELERRISELESSQNP